MNPRRRVANVGVAALARETGLSQSAVSQKMSAGQTPERIRQEAARSKGRAPVPSKKPDNPQNKPTAGRRGPGKPPLASEYDLIVQGRERMNALDEMKFRRAKALAERSEIDNMLKRGELLPVAYVRQWATRYLTDGRDMLLQGPSELRDTLAAESDPLKVDAILRNWLERVMGKFQQLERLWGAGEEEQVA